MCVLLRVGKLSSSLIKPVSAIKYLRHEGVIYTANRHNIIIIYFPHSFKYSSMYICIV